jgi:putative transport protein
MVFVLAKWIMNPFVLMFVAVFSGMLFGKIKFGKFNFGVSGTLFTGLLFGWGVVKYAKGFVDGDEWYSAAQSFLSKGIIPKDFFYLFLILFVATVGLLAAKDIGAVLKKYGLKFVALGLIITFVGAAATYGMTLFTTNVLQSDSTPYEVSGVYTGALTSSPGLAAATETATEHATKVVSEYDSMNDKEKAKVLKMLDADYKVEDYPQLTADMESAFIQNAEAGIGIGHAIGYPFGVIIVIIAVNFFPKIFRINIDEEQKIFNKEMDEARAASGGRVIEETDFDLIALCVAMLFGYTIGKFGIDLNFIGINQTFSLGSTGGVLVGSLILGYVGKIGPVNFRMNSKILGIVRQLSLAFFLAIVGLRYGFKVFDALASSGAILAVVGLVVGLVAMLVGFFIGKYVFKINWIMLSGAICGGMTSTPGLGAAVDAIGSDDPAAGYGATYPFALLGMVLFTIILHGLPM